MSDQENELNEVDASRNTTRRTSRAQKSKPMERFAKLRELKNATGSRSRLAQYTVNEQEDIYDEVDEDHYKTIVKGRLKEEDFVVDDDGRGYADNGLEEWDDDREEESYDEGVGSNKGKAGKRKRTKQEKADAAKLRAKPEQQIQAFFQKSAQNVHSGGSSKKTAAPSIKEEEMMADIFNDLDTDVAHPPLPKKSRKQPIGNRHIEQSLFGNRSNASASSLRSSFKSIDHLMATGSSSMDEVGGMAFEDDFPGFDASEMSYEHNDLMGDSETGVKTEYANEKEGTSLPDVAAAKIETSPNDISSTIDDKINTKSDGAIKVKELKHSTAPMSKTTASLLRPAVPETAKPISALPQPTTTLSTSTASWASSRMLQEVSSSEQTVNTSIMGGNGTGGLLAENVLESDGTLRLYWMDAAERGEVVYVFGKVLNRATNLYISCCVTIKNIERNMFVLPRKRRLDASGAETDIEVGMIDVYKEFDELRKKYKIPQWLSKEVVRNYAFETAGVPACADYLKVITSFHHPQLPNDLSGQTFSHVFGTNTTALEHFLLKRKLMGPGWLEIKNPQVDSVNISWAKFAVTVNDPKMIRRVTDLEGTTMTKTTPPLNLLSINLRTVTNAAHKNEIIMATVIIHENVAIDQASDFKSLPCQKFTVVRQPSDRPIPSGFMDLATQSRFRVEVVRTEGALLNYLVAMLARWDPDVLIGHNFVGFDLNILLDRMKEQKVEGWSRLGRLKRSLWPKMNASGDTTFAMKAVAGGRLICDTYLQAKDLIRSKNYKLGELASSQLSMPRDEVDFDQILLYFNTARDLLNLCQHCCYDAYLAMGLGWKLQALPLTKELTCLAGNLWSKTLLTGRAERNEMLLLHEFHNMKYVCPDKTFGTFKNGPKNLTGGPNDEGDENGEGDGAKKTAGRRKPAYAGGLVLEPKKGLYDKFVLLLDFNSLYPSIIQEYNICFTTVKRGTDCPNEEEIPDVPETSNDTGVLPKLLKSLVDRRRNIKNLMKHSGTTSAEMAHYDIVQKALKLTANSMYGCLGFTHSRFYAKPLAMLITSKGREILQNTVDLAEKQNLEVIYGDTDSIMINTNSTTLDEVKRIGEEFKREVNRRYKLLEIETDGIFKRMLLLRKKKYAALVVQERDGRLETITETKGLDMVRRDWCELSKDISQYVLNQILCGEDCDQVVENIHQHLTTAAQEVRDGLAPIEKFVINKGLTKIPEHYADKSSQPHVTVALRMKAKGQSVQVGETVPYVICQSENLANEEESRREKESFAARAHHPDDLRKQGSKLVIDYEWYLNQQVHPPIARLLDPISGTDAARIAVCLGLDASKYRGPMETNQPVDQLQTLSSQMTDAERFKDVTRFVPKCRHCGESSEMEAVVDRRTISSDASAKATSNEKSVLVCALDCPNRSCGKPRPIPSLECQLVTALRSHIQRYIDSWLVCDDLGCRNRTRMMSVYGRKCLQSGCRGTMVYEYSDAALYIQLLYYETLFDVDRSKAKAEGTPDADAVRGIAETRRESFGPLLRAVRRYLDQCARRYVDLGRLFSFYK